MNEDIQQKIDELIELLKTCEHTETNCKNCVRLDGCLRFMRLSIAATLSLLQKVLLEQNPNASKQSNEGLYT